MKSILTVCAFAWYHVAAVKEAQWQAREERAKQYYEKHLEERRKKLEEQRMKEEKRRAAVEEKRRLKLEEDKVLTHTHTHLYKLVGPKSELSIISSYFHA